jgi:hypothetical protein
MVRVIKFWRMFGQQRRRRLQDVCLRRLGANVFDEDCENLNLQIWAALDYIDKTGTQLEHIRL